MRISAAGRYPNGTGDETRSIGQWRGAPAGSLFTAIKGEPDRIAMIRTSRRAIGLKTRSAFVQRRLPVYRKSRNADRFIDAWGCPGTGDGRARAPRGSGWLRQGVAG